MAKYLFFGRLRRMVTHVLMIEEKLNGISIFSYIYDKKINKEKNVGLNTWYK
jgi:hypothetical protein